jgi:hypothetical protein
MRRRATATRPLTIFVPHANALAPIFAGANWMSRDSFRGWHERGSAQNSVMC